MIDVPNIRWPFRIATLGATKRRRIGKPDWPLRAASRGGPRRRPSPPWTDFAHNGDRGKSDERRHRVARREHRLYDRRALVRSERGYRLALRMDLARVWDLGQTFRKST